MATTLKSVNLKSELSVTEILSNTVLSDKDVTHAINDDLYLDRNTTPDAELVWSKLQALTAGSATIDLTTITDSEGNTLVTTGKKVRAIKVKATSSNANALSLTVGASNGYQLLGAAWKVTLSAGDHFLAYLGTSAPDVGASAKTIDLAGTGTQSVQIIILFG